MDLISHAEAGLGQLLQLFVQEGNRRGEIHIVDQGWQEKLEQFGEEAFQDVLPGFITIRPIAIWLRQQRRLG